MIFVELFLQKGMKLKALCAPTDPIWPLKDDRPYPHTRKSGRVGGGKPFGDLEIRKPSFHPERKLFLSASHSILMDIYRRIKAIEGTNVAKHKL